MPTYGYECRECGYRFEKMQSIKADPLSVCPHCGQSALKRLLGTGGGIIFKGAGFYCNDYKNKGGKPAGTGEGSEK